MNYDLPTSVEIGGESYAVRSDYRAILDICAAMSDVELNTQEKSIVALSIFYPDLEKIPSEGMREALERCFWFINCGGQPENLQQPKLVDWEQDFPYIIAPINRVLGQEIRSVPYLHWWTFISAYYEIGDCTFAQIVSIRDKKVRGKKLEKAEAEWYKKNQNLVDFRTVYSDAEKDFFKQWGAG